MSHLIFSEEEIRKSEMSRSIQYVQYVALADNIKIDNGIFIDLSADEINWWAPRTESN